MRMNVEVPASVLAVLAMGASSFGSIFNDGNPDLVLEKHRGRQTELLEQSNAILAKADSEERELTTEESTAIENNDAEINRLDAECGRREALNAHNARFKKPNGRKTDPDPTPADPRPNNAVIPGVPGVPRAPFTNTVGNHGFGNAGEFLMAVVKAGIQGAIPDNRLRAATLSTVSTEGVGADGGFAVPPDFLSTIMGKETPLESLFGRCWQVPINGNSFTMPIDMTTPWQASGGIQAYWESETAAATQSKVSLEQVTVRASKLRALVPVTEEALEDAPSLAAYISRRAPEIIDYRISHAITWGNGVGKPLGFMGSPALVTQAAVGGQTADTINATNVAAMFGRLPANSIANAVWLIYPGAWHQLPLMSIGQMPVWLPPSGLAAAPFGTLMGRPVIPHQVCAPLGDIGDIMLVDLRNYLTVVKSGGVKSETSIHLWFDQDTTAFKFSIRLGGMPWWSTSTAAREGTFAQSPFITLAAR